MVTEPLPASRVPLSVPPSTPLPEFRLKLTTVSVSANSGLPLLSWAWTTTLKPAPTAGDEPLLTDVIANRVGGAPSRALTVQKLVGELWFRYSVVIQEVPRKM